MNALIVVSGIVLLAAIELASGGLIVSAIADHWKARRNRREANPVEPT